MMPLRDPAAVAGARPALQRLTHPVVLHPKHADEFRLLSIDALTSEDVANWDELGEYASTTSVFACPWFARAGLAHCPEGQRTSLAVVGDGDGRWLGVVPLIRRLRYGKAMFPHWAVWTHPNQFRGTPLVRRGSELLFWRRLFDGLRQSDRTRLALRLTSLPLSEAVTEALLQACREDNRACKFDRRYARALLDTTEGDDDGHLKGSRRRRIESLERKVEREIGPLNWRVSGDATELLPAIARFLALESAGWKGKAGSSLDSAVDTRDFFAAVTREAAARGYLQVTELLAGEHLLASSVHFLNGGEGFGYKMTYDEQFGAYGPGLLLLARLTRHFREHGPLRVDSCCAPEQEPVSSLWPGRLELVDCGIALGGPIRRHGLGLLDCCERLYHLRR